MLSVKGQHGTRVQSTHVSLRPYVRDVIEHSIHSFVILGSKAVSSYVHTPRHVGRL